VGSTPREKRRPTATSDDMNALPTRRTHRVQEAPTWPPLSGQRATGFLVTFPHATVELPPPPRRWHTGTLRDFLRQSEPNAN